jgi:hypothetical protein
MMRMTRALGALLIMLLNASAGAAQDIPRDGSWIQLFDGNSLNGWTPKITGHEAGQNVADTFRVEDGVLKVSYDGYGGTFDGRFGHLFYKETYSNYILRLEYRFVGNQVAGGPEWAFKNSGVMIHGQSPQSMRKDQEFPVSVEVQLLGGRGHGARTTANVCTPGTHVVMNGALVTRHCNDSTSRTFDGDEWVTLVVEVRGNGTIRHFVNGEQVLEYEQPQYDEGDADAKRLMGSGSKMLSGGTISLQSESHPIEFRKVEIMLLK